MSDLRGAVAVGLLVAFVGFLLVGWVVRKLAGPVFARELTVLARRGYQPRLRAGLVGMLLVGLLLTYAAEFGWDALAGQRPTVDPRSGRFAERFAITTLAVQLLAVIVLTPAVVGSAITEERDRGTLDLLRTSDLTDREIVLGKLLARLLVVVGVVAAGLPVLALTMLFGGVDPEKVLAVYAITAVTACGLGAASVYLGTVQDSLRAVLATTYTGVLALTLSGACCWSVPGVSGLSPAALAVQAWLSNELMIGALVRNWWASAAVFGLLYGGGGLLLLLLAVRRVRGTTVRRVTELATVQPVSRRFYATPLRDDDDPLVWQEHVFGGRRFGGGDFRVACGWLMLLWVGAGLFVGLASAVERGTWIGRPVGTVVRPLLAVAGVLLPLAIGLRLVGSVAGERERQTLDALLMLPDDRRVILRAKAWAAVGWAAWMVLLVAGLLVFAVLVGGIRVVGGLVATVHLLALVGGAVGLAAWLTVSQRTSARATILFLIVLLVVNIAPLLLAPLADWLTYDAGDQLRGGSPAVGVWGSANGAFWPAVGPVVLNAAAGLVLWRLAEHRLEHGELLR